jgi:hypothetical protein
MLCRTLRGSRSFDHVQRYTFLLPTLIFLYMSWNVYRFFILIFFFHAPLGSFLRRFLFLAPMFSFNGEDCLAGQYTDLPQQLACKTCMIGTYQNEETQNECKGCPIGTFNTDNLKIIDQHDQLSDCADCVEGQYSTTVAGSSCNQCNPGTYSDQVGQTSCKNCPVGTNNQNSNGNDASVCIDCVEGKYNDQLGLANCINCNAGLYGTEIGAHVEETTCLSCPAGWFAGLSGAVECVECPTETYLSDILIVRTSPRTFCLACPTATGTGATTCAGCAAGKFGAEGLGGGCQGAVCSSFCCFTPSMS